MNIKRYIKKIVDSSNKTKIYPIVTPIEDSKFLQGHTALISGGSGGIGIAIAKSLLDSGCSVILGGTKSEKLLAAKSKLGDEYADRIATVLVDMSDIKLLEETIQNICKTREFDIFVNSAGVHTEKLDYWNITPEEYDRVLDINLKGPYFACLSIAKFWRENSIKGHILLISSSRGAEPAWSPYGISKWGIDGMTKGLATLFTSEGIIINAIAPGSTATPLLGIKEGDSIESDDNKLGRMAMPDEVGTYARLLVSSAGDMLAGETIHVSGGRGVWDIR